MIISFDIRHLSDSKLTPRWLYAGLLDQMGVEAKINRGDSKRILQKEIENVRTTQGRKAVCILDEAHLLDSEGVGSIERGGNHAEPTRVCA